MIGSERIRIMLMLCLALLLLLTLPVGQAILSNIFYHVTLLDAKIGISTLIVNLKGFTDEGTEVTIDRIDIVWLRSPLNDKSMVIFSGEPPAVIVLPRVLLNRVARVDFYGRVTWIDFYNVEKILILAYSNLGYFGLKTLCTEISRPVLNVNLNVRMRKNEELIRRTSEILDYSQRLVETMNFEKKSAFITLYPDKGVEIDITVPKGAPIWLQSKTRYATSYDELPNSSWDSSPSAVSSSWNMVFKSRAYAPNGGSWVKCGTKIRWTYERWEIYDSYNPEEIIEIIEIVYPSAHLGGISYLSYGSYSPPSVSGNTVLVGDGGAGIYIDLGGTWQIGGISVTLIFTPSYEKKISIRLGFILRYTGCTAFVYVFQNAYDPLEYDVYAFDKGTNWAKLYTAWVRE